MKWALGVALAVLLAASGLSAAQSGEPSEPDDDASGSSSSGPSSSPSSSPRSSSSKPPEGPCANATAEEAQACKERFCRDHPSDPRCPRPSDRPNGTKSSNASRPRDDDAAWPPACDIKGNPVYCREVFCRNHENATFCRPVVRDAVREALSEAAEKRHVGAEVDLKRGHRDEAVKVLPYDNVTVEVQGTEQVATEANPLTIRLSANLTSGRTFSFTLDPDLLPAGGAESLILRYFDVRDDGTRTEVVLEKADSLSDVLDTTNDKGQPEFWVVEDANGLQVLLYVPHWSVHELTIAGLAELVQPSVLVGLAVGAAVSIIAGVALFLPRRRDD